MTRISSIPEKCQGRCPLENLDEELLLNMAFSRNCADPIIVDGTPVENEYDVDNRGTVNLVTDENRKVGSIACTNNGVALYIKEVLSK